MKHQLTIILVFESYDIAFAILVQIDLILEDTTLLHVVISSRENSNQEVKHQNVCKERMNDH